MDKKCKENELRNFYRGRTVVVVAHRLSTVHDADQMRILLMRDFFFTTCAPSSDDSLHHEETRL